MTIRIDAVSDVGCVRLNNEDMALVYGEQLRDDKMAMAFELPENGRMTAIVSDGMGGYDRGEVASEMATGLFDAFLDALPEGLQVDEVVMELKRWCRETNGKIMDAADGTGMGCTFTGLFTYGEQAFIVNIGDSRTYRLRHDFLKQMTTDHSERERRQDDSIPSNLIYNALGAKDTFIDVIPTRMVEGDKFLVCSDGLSDMIDNDTIERMMMDGCNAQALVDAAKEAGGLDNVTVVMVEVIQNS